LPDSVLGEADEIAASMIAFIFTVICALASAQPQHRTAPTFEINLDKPPEQRFSVIFDPAAGFNETVWEFYNMYFANNERLKEALYHLVATRGEEVPEMQGEIRGLAMGSKLPLPFVQGIQMLYELQTVMVPIVNVSRLPKRLVSTLNYTFERETAPPEWAALSQIPWRGPGCTGIIATNTLDGTVSHARNLDFMPHRIMSRLVYTGIFTRNGTELYRSQMVAGYVQAITGMRRGPNGFGLERNTRYTDHPGGFEQALSNLKAGRLLNGWQLRQTLEACATYECALDRLSTVPYASTEYTILSGVRKGAILSRSPDYVAYKQTLGIPADTQPASYIIMTNFDFFYHDIREWFDPTGGEMFRPRRLVAQGLLNATLASGRALTPKVLFDVINAEGVLAGGNDSEGGGDGTIFQALINVELDLWNVSIPVLKHRRRDDARAAS